MKKEWAEKWVKALRSGRYTQARRRLYNEKTGGYCCLGVLCRVAGKKFYNGKCLGANIVLPNEVMKLTGIYEANPGIMVNEIDKTSLAQLNDMGKSFKRIADLIEKNWKQL
ncbi:MAG TPA: hypothetical protein VFR24_27555 [Candidatus Angelobacter sp.]|nr:hypothetical protein [Candidatus Angelobacter sp.]